MAINNNSSNSGGTSASRVQNTGIALVHQGEVILPAAGSEAQAEQVMNDARTVIQYHFPVEIEVFDNSDIDIEPIVAEVLSRLNRALNG